MTERHPSIELIRGLHNVPPQDAGCALTMGKFDGVHLGHQALLAKTRAAADALGLPATVLSFDPSPREFFKPDAPVRRISTLRDKLGALESFGVDRLVLARFSHALADTSPEDFVEQILVARLGVKAIIVGDDLRFGRNRAGDYNYLQQCGQRMGFDVYSVGTVDVGGERCSSSAVRDSLIAPRNYSAGPMRSAAGFAKACSWDASWACQPPTLQLPSVLPFHWACTR